VEKFDGVPWTEVASVPSTIGLCAAVCTLGSKIYLFGPTTYRYDTDDDSWTMITREEPGPGMMEHRMSASLVGDHIILKGPRTTVVFDPVTAMFRFDRWDSVHHQCVVMDGKLHGMGHGGYINVYDDRGDNGWRPSEDLFPFCGTNAVFTTWCPREALSNRHLDSMIVTKSKKLLIDRAWARLGSSSENDHLQNF
jgi:hypothetical protein